MAAGSNRITFGWILVIIFWLISVLMFTVPTEDTSIGRDSDGDGVDDGCDEDPDDWFNDYDYCDNSSSIEAGGCCCLSGFLCLLIVQSGKDAKNKAATQVFYIAQTPQQTPQVVHHVVQQQVPVVQPTQVPVIQPTPAPAPVPVSQPSKPQPLEKQSTDVEAWHNKARNLELARDWEGAAQAYQKAGLYHEAGRIRQQHMEKNEPQVKIDIAQLGDNIQDSVVMKEGQGQNEDYQG